MNIEVKVVCASWPYGGKVHKRGSTLSIPRTTARAMIALGKVEEYVPAPVEKPAKVDAVPEKGTYKTKDMKAEG